MEFRESDVQQNNPQQQIYVVSHVWAVSTQENVFLKGLWDFPGDSDGKESSCSVETQVQSLGAKKIPWRREWLPTPVFFPGESMDRGARQATIRGVPKSWTRLGD